MTEPQAYLNGRIVPLREAALPVWDGAVVQGATVTDMVRTFRGRPFRLQQHLDRFAMSRDVIGVDLPESDERLAEIIAEMIEINRERIGDPDLGILMFATPGAYLPYAPEAEPSSRPTLCVHPFRLAWARFARGYRDGVSLAVPQVRQLPAACVPPEIKHRSRLHWRLADREVQRVDPIAAALLLDDRGFVTETNTGNLFAVQGDRLLTPRRETTLGGVSQACVEELAQREGARVERADITPEDVLSCGEALLSSTTYCLLPVTRLNGAPLGDGKPGPMFQRLMRRWSEEVGLDIIAQAQTHAAS